MKHDNPLSVWIARRVRRFYNAMNHQYDKHRRRRFVYKAHHALRVVRIWEKNNPRPRGEH